MELRIMSTVRSRAGWIAILALLPGLTSACGSDSVDATATSAVSSTTMPLPPPSDCDLSAAAVATVAVTSLSEGAQVQQGDVVSGTATDMPAGCDLWLVVLPPDGGYFPQRPGPINVLAGGSWKAPVRFGESGHHGLKFLLYVVIANANATTAFHGFIQTFKGGEPGMPNLPDGAVAVAQVEVVRA
jgi:hypothetical protein